jgi:hypothetical protein
LHKKNGGTVLARFCHSGLAIVCAVFLAATTADAAHRSLHLHVKIMTGNEGLQADNKLQAVVRLSDGKNQTFTLHEGNTPGWKPHTTFETDLDLKNVDRRAVIIGIMLQFDPGQQGTHDRGWNMQGISVWNKVDRAGRLIEAVGGPGDYDCVMQFKADSGRIRYFIPL